MDQKNLEKLTRDMFLSLSGRMRNLTRKEKEELNQFFETGIAEKFKLKCGQMVFDPVFCSRVQRAVEKYGEVVRDIIDDIMCGFAEDGLNGEEPEQFFSKEELDKIRGG